MIKIRITFIGINLVPTTDFAVFDKFGMIFRQFWEPLKENPAFSWEIRDSNHTPYMVILSSRN